MIGHSKFIWGAILILLIGTLVLARNADRRVLEKEDHLKVTQKAGGGVTILAWSSAIDLPMARRFEEAYKEHKNTSSIFEIHLSSPGGRLTEGRQVIEVIKQIKKNHHVVTYVGAGQSCLSMCVPIFLAADERRAEATSRWLFHQPTVYDVASGEQHVQTRLDQAFRTKRFSLRYFAASDVDEDWLRGLEQDWQAGDVWKTGAQLYMEGSNIITYLDQ